METLYFSQFHELAEKYKGEMSLVKIAKWKASTTEATPHGARETVYLFFHRLILRYITRVFKKIKFQTFHKRV